MNQPQVSIIIPVYNAEKYLQQCLDSVIAQTYTNWEGLLIDDGSTDGSGRICDEYSVADTRFRVIHKENGGVCSARNRGLSVSCGEYVLFADADDYLFPFSSHSLANGLSDTVRSSVFCIIFRKPFVVIRNKDRGVSRLDTLLNNFNLANRAINNAGDINMDLFSIPLDNLIIERELEVGYNLAFDFFTQKLKNA